METFVRDNSEQMKRAAQLADDNLRLTNILATYKLEVCQKERELQALDHSIASLLSRYQKTYIQPLLVPYQKAETDLLRS